MVPLWGVDGLSPGCYDLLWEERVRRMSLTKTYLDPATSAITGQCPDRLDLLSVIYTLNE